MRSMEASQTIGSWLRCYRCWSQELEIQVHYEGIHRIDPVTGERAEVVDELQEAVVQCLDCMHDQPHLAFHNGRIQPVEDRWERMVAGTPWVASCTVTVDADAVETCSGPEAADALAFAAASAAHDYTALCRRILAPSLVDDVTSIGLPCPRAIARGLGDVRDAALAIGAITIDGDRASVQVRTSAAGQKPATDTLQLVRLRGGWRIASLVR